MGARGSKAAQLELITRPDSVIDEVARLEGRCLNATLPHLDLPAHHEVLASDVVLRRLHSTLRSVADRGPEDFSELLLQPGVGARTLFSLAMVAEVVHGEEHRFCDPGRFAFAHGGKDGHPFPVPLDVYDETIRVLKDALERGRLGNQERLSAIERLDRQARRVDDWAGGPSFDEVVERERTSSRALGGRSVMDDVRQRKKASKSRPPAGQQSLFEA